MSSEYVNLGLNDCSFDTGLFCYLAEAWLYSFLLCLQVPDSFHFAIGALMWHLSCHLFLTLVIASVRSQMNMSSDEQYSDSDNLQVLGLR